MNTALVSDVVWAVLAAAAAGLSASALRRRVGGRSELGGLMRWPVLRWLVLLGWMWLGWHLFAR